MQAFFEKNKKTIITIMLLIALFAASYTAGNVVATNFINELTLKIHKGAR